MSKYQDIATNVVKAIGGVDNIDSVTNCMTRLRFSLKDLKKVNQEELEKVKGVQGVVNKNGQFQVVIGSDVSNVCDEIKKLGNFSETVKSSDEKVSLINKILGAITAIFQPVIPAICGAGMLKAVLAILNALKLVETGSQSYTLISMFADAAFYFLPIYLAFSSAKRFGCNPFIAAVLGGILIHPTFTGLVSAGEPLSYFGLPIKLVSYGSSVAPAILIVWVQSYVEKFARKISPNAVKVFLVPLIVFLIMAPLALVVIGPIGSYIGAGLYYVFDFLNNQARWVMPVLMGTLTPLFVMTGMHYSFASVQLAQYTTLGYGTLLGPGMLASNISQAGSCFAVALRTKDKDMKATAISAGTTALFGITEPALYGVTMKLKKPLWAVMISGGIAGLWGGLTNMRTYASATAGITALPVYICDDLSNVRNAVICIIIALVVSFILTLIFGFDTSATSENTDTTNTKSAPLNKTVSVNAPLSGEVVKLSEVKDEVFSKEIMGKGVAIKPNEGTVYAPFDGIVNTVFPTKHAIGLTSDSGVEVIIHLGLDTVELKGEPFEVYVKDGDKVKAGQKLAKMDIKTVSEKGYDTITPIVVTNTNNFVDVVETENKEVKANEELLKVFE